MDNLKNDIFFTGPPTIYPSMACWSAIVHLSAPRIVVKLVQRALPPPLSSLWKMPDGLNYFRITHILPWTLMCNIPLYGIVFCLLAPTTMVRLPLVAGSEGPCHKKPSAGLRYMSRVMGGWSWWPHTRAGTVDHGRPSWGLVLHSTNGEAKKLAPNNNKGMTYQTNEKHLTNLREYFVGVVKLAINC